MENLFLRANILKRNAFGNNVFIYEDHRYILNIIYTAFQRGVLNEPVTVIYFDRHDDGRTPVADMNLLRKYRNQMPTEKEFWSFVEWNLDPQDGDWIKTGMELGLIGDAILLGCSDPANFDEFSNEYLDHLGTMHNIYNVGTIWGGLSYQGWLTDVAQQEKYSPVWELLGLEDHLLFNIDKDKMKTKFILDFDLDCFTTKLENYTIAWPIEYFDKLFNDFEGKCEIKPREFLVGVIQKAEFITIARETSFCGGIENNNLILESLNSVLFDGQL